VAVDAGSKVRFPHHLTQDRGDLALTRDERYLTEIATLKEKSSLLAFPLLLAAA
jgi:hypothetical protein